MMSSSPKNPASNCVSYPFSIGQQLTYGNVDKLIIVIALLISCINILAGYLSKSGTERTKN